MLKTRRLAGASLVVSLAVGGVPLASAGDKPRRVVVVVEAYRSSTAPTHLAFAFTNGTDGSQSAVAGVWVLVGGRGLAGGGLIVTPGGYQAPETNLTGGPTGCVTLPVRPALICESRVAGSSTASVTLDTTSATDPDRVVFAFLGDAGLLTFGLRAESSGWKVRTLRRRVQLLRTQDLANTYVASSSEGAERFQRAAAMGGRRGSLAAAAVPCRSLGAAGATGYGRAELTGGLRPKPLSCPEGPLLAFDRAVQGTTWSLAGDITGSTASGIQATGQLTDVFGASEDVRLLVVDGPV